MLHKNPASVVENALNDPSRICPVFAAPALISGQRLSVQWRGESITVRAPRPMLKKLFEWCQGHRSLTELGNLSVQTWGDDRMSRFVADLLDAGVMVDAALQLPAIAEATVDPLARFGLPAHAGVWSAVSALASCTAEPETQVHVMPQTSSSLDGLWRDRRSAREFGGQGISKASLAGVLRAAYGAVVDSDHTRRTVPSAGALHTLRLGVVLLDPIDDLPSGAYLVKFDSSRSSEMQSDVALSRIDSSPTDIFRASNAPRDLTNVRVVLVAWADLSLTALKYRNRAYPFLMLEAGAALQNVALYCADAKLAWSPYGNYSPSRMAALFEVPTRATILATGLLGSLNLAALETRHPDALPLTLTWSEELPSLPFHAATAKIDVESNTEGLAWGRAADPVLALDKAIAEAVERYAYRTPRCLRWGTLLELPNAVHPERIIAFSPAQYRRKDFPFTRLRDNERTLWTEAVSARDGHDVLVHADCVFHAKGLEALRDGPIRCWATSSGCASHLDIVAAQNAALWELVERDAFMRHWAAQTPGTRIDEVSLPAGFRFRIDWLKANGCTVALFVLDRGVLPAVMVAIRNDEKHFTCFGAGAGADLAGALETALGEAEIGAHARLAALAAVVVTPSQVRFPAHHVDLFATRRYYKRADALLAGARSRTFQTLANAHRAACGDVLASLLSKGLDPIFVDLTVPDAPRTTRGARLHTVRALVPGLLPMTFGAGRMPMGMLKTCAKAALFPHPFA
ncbi:YcaO-like family protein [Pandoraea bronchicola]|uniref:YcaO domain-containing protein n=1 Tax=Pandoraea bronchicola TaxID=2508287 RepID=A0A5E5BXZ6_9BURK|nr:YcaO-like family protein [Pandoraea bronchicola]VVE90679.1 hypothetical protein PBR20603_04666 [Pandoraea bronchicola]